MSNHPSGNAQATPRSPSLEHVQVVAIAVRRFVEAARHWLGPDCPDVPRFAAEMPVYEEAKALANAIGKVDGRCFDPYTAKATGWPHDVGAALMRLCFSFDSLIASWHWPLWLPDDQVDSEYQEWAARLHNRYILWLVDREMFQRTARKLIVLIRRDSAELLEDDRIGEGFRRLRELETRIDEFELEPLAKGAPARIANTQFDHIETSLSVLEAATGATSTPTPADEARRTCRTSENDDKDGEDEDT